MSAEASAFDAELRRRGAWERAGLRQRPGDQPLPVPNQHSAIADLVTADLEARRRLGIARYGSPLQPHNGRDAPRDLYEELLDGACYIRQAIYERDNPAVPSCKCSCIPGKPCHSDLLVCECNDCPPCREAEALTTEAEVARLSAHLAAEQLATEAAETENDRLRARIAELGGTTQFRICQSPDGPLVDWTDVVVGDYTQFVGWPNSAGRIRLEFRTVATNTTKDGTHG